MTTTIGPDNPAFVGFIALSERLNPTESYFTCPSHYRFVSSATFNGCCAGTEASCPIATTCVDGTLSFASSASPCRAGACQSQLLVPSTEGPTSTAYFCGDQLKLGKTLYRADPATTTGPSAGATGPSLSSATASSSSPFTYGPAPGTPPPSPPSRTWIAGAVLAPLILSVLLGLGLCLWLRRGRRRRRAAEEDGAKSVGDSSREDVAFYYNQDMKLDLRESTGPWSPYSSRFGSLRTANEGDRPASHHELAGDRSTQVYLELPDMNSPPAVELPAGSVKKVAKRAGPHVHY